MSSSNQQALTETDYTHILQYYQKNVPKSKRLLKLQAERILADKLCRCIKKVGTANEDRSIGICTRTVVNAKGFDRGTFTCKRKRTIQLTKSKKTKKTKKTQRTR